MLGIYSPANVIVTIGGIHTLSGYISGSFLDIKKDIAPYVMRRACDGTIARLYIKDNSYTVTFTLAQFSESNDVLNKIQKVDELTHMAYFPLLIKDMHGSSVFFSPTAWIQSVPDQTFSTSVESRTWQLKAVDAAIVIGNNIDSDTGIVDQILAVTPVVGDFLEGLN